MADFPTFHIDEDDLELKAARQVSASSVELSDVPGSRTVSLRFEETPKRAVAERLVSEGEWDELARILPEMKPEDLVDIFRELSSLQRLTVFRAMPRKTTDAFLALSPSEKSVVVDGDIPMEELKQLIAPLDAPTRLALFQSLSSNAVEVLMPLMTPAELDEVRSLFAYPANSLGRHMQALSTVVLVGIDWTLKRVREEIRKPEHKNKDLTHVFVVSERMRFEGVLSLYTVLTGEDDTPVAECVQEAPLLFQVLTPQDEFLAELHQAIKNELPLSVEPRVVHVPIIDKSNEENVPLLRGVMSVHDALRMAVAASARHAGAGAGHGPAIELSYSKTGDFDMWKKRVIWLFMLVMVNIGTSAVINSFEAVLERNIKLSAFLPLLIGTGGNAGAQASTLLVAALASRDITLRDWFPTLLKEIRASLYLAPPLAAGSFLVAFVLDAGVDVAGTVAASCAALIFCANLIGMIVPFVATLSKLDPAVVCSPVITTTLDVLGVAVYLWFADFIVG